MSMARQFIPTCWSADNFHRPITRPLERINRIVHATLSRHVVNLISLQYEDAWLEMLRKILDKRILYRQINYVAFLFKEINKYAF